MCGTVEKNINGDVIQVKVSESEESAHITCFGTCYDNIADAMKISLEDKQAFFLILPGDRAIEAANKRWMESSKELFACAMGLFRTYCAADEDKQYANKIMDKVTKDSDVRKKNMLRHCDLVLKKEPEDEKLPEQMRKIRLDCIHDVQRCMNSQSLYLRYYEKGTTFESPVQKAIAESAFEAEKIRNAVPEGSIYRPSYIYPKQPVPPGERVPDWPDPYSRVFEVPVEEKVYDKELGEFVLPEGYVSEDGLIDDKSVVWHPETREVEIGYRGGERVTWNYVKHVNTWEVWEPGSWAAEYQIRSTQQNLADMQPGVLQHRTGDDDEIPYYNKIPDNRK